MSQEELLSLLKGFEWKDVEFKLAQRGVPADAYKTVSAFSNTEGGSIIFGVNNGLEVKGVIEVDKVQKEFLSCLRSGDKLNKIINVEEKLLEHDGKILLIFFVPEASRREKPIYLNGDITKSYIRKGGCDEKCSGEELSRFLRDSMDMSFDNGVVRDVDVEDFYDKESVRWYRNISERQQGQRHTELSDVEFLNEWGYIIEYEQELVPTRAGVLVFGKPKYVKQLLPRAIVDYQRIDYKFEDWTPDVRWNDRVVVEDNLIQAWQILVEKYFRLADKPFSLDQSSLRRHDAPPDYIAFREATINLLIHQDFGDAHRKPVIKFFKDRIVFFNPGEAYQMVEQLLDSTEKDVRNPSIVNAFRRIGLSDQAGTGIRSIMASCRKMGFVPAVLENNKSEKSYTLTVLKEPLYTEKSLLLLSFLEAEFNQQERDVVTLIYRNNEIDIPSLRALTGLNESQSLTLLSRLVTQNIIFRQDGKKLWKFVDHIAEWVLAAKEIVSGNLVSDQPQQKEGSLVSDQPQESKKRINDTPLIELTDRQKKIILMCEIPQKLSDIMEVFNVTHRDFFRKKHLMPLIKAKLITMTYPEEINHPEQGYKITNSAIELLLSIRNAHDHENNV